MQRRLVAELHRPWVIVMRRRCSNALVLAWIVVSASACSSRVRLEQGGPVATSHSIFVDDFDAAWAAVGENYAYFESKQTDWSLARMLYRPIAETVRSKREFIELLEDVLEELYDPHLHLGVNSPSSPRLVPSGTDLWAEVRDGRAVITSVRDASEAERAGLRAGMEIVTIEGRPVMQVVQERLPRALNAPDPAADDWALRAALAGRRDSPVRLHVHGSGRDLAVTFEPAVARHPVPLSSEVLEGNIGYVRIHDSLGDIKLIAAWDEALGMLQDTRGLVIDLRDTPSGGNTTMARALLSRLTAEERPYQRHELPAEARRHGVRRIWIERVAPRGSFSYHGKIAVLVGRWTASMGEGLTIGLDVMPQVTVIGTPMAGLRGAIHTTALPHSGFEIRIPSERLYHVDGTPREEYVPQLAVPADGASGDRQLETALALLRGFAPESGGGEGE